jgi:methionyl aminopeptidase
MPNLDKISAMREGGKRLRQVKKQLQTFTKVGVSFAEIEAEAQRLIKEAGAIPNFALVPGYEWATCVMKNDEVCHGIPTDKKYVDDGDIITIDVGLLYHDWHLDTSISFGVGNVDSETKHFLEIGRKSLKKAINKARVGKTIYDVSKGMQQVVERAGFGAVYQLTGHAIGEELHMDPAVPCIAQRSDKKLKLYAGQTLAIEIMYAAGNADLKLDKDGWTYRTKDGSLTGMFEETVLITANGPEVLT